MTELSDQQEKLLSTLEADAFKYFIHEVNLANGLVKDCTKTGWPSSITAVGMALSAYPVGVERNFITREEAIERTLRKLRFFAGSEQSTRPEATGYKGFYYHFLDMQTGRRAWECELSTIDTTFLFAGMLAAAAYFDRDSAEEQEIRKLADELYRRADWRYDREYLFAGPLFTHQFSHIWIDFRGIQDEFMRDHGSDYFENSRHATYAQQEYARQNPHGFKGYSEVCWGLTACEGPGPNELTIDGVRRFFFDYVARGVPDGPDDGTVAPWAVVASLPFASEIVLPTLEHFNEIEVGIGHPYGLEATFNPTFPDEKCRECGWLSPWHFGINQGPIVLMIENYRSEFLWKLMKKCPYLVNGLRRAGFKGGWL